MGGAPIATLLLTNNWGCHFLKLTELLLCYHGSLPLVGSQARQAGDTLKAKEHMEILPACFQRAPGTSSSCSRACFKEPAVCLA